MRHALDICNITMKMIVLSSKMILGKDFIMLIFDEFTNELPPFKDFLYCTFQEK